MNLGPKTPLYAFEMMHSLSKRYPHSSCFSYSSQEKEDWTLWPVRRPFFYELNAERSTYNQVGQIAVFLEERVTTSVDLHADVETNRLKLNASFENKAYKDGAPLSNLQPSIPIIIDGLEIPTYREINENNNPERLSSWLKNLYNIIQSARPVN